MLAQIVAHVLQVVIAAGLAFQIATLARHTARLARKRWALRVRAARTKSPVPPARVRARRCRNYRLALRAARASVSA